MCILGQFLACFARGGSADSLEKGYIKPYNNLATIQNFSIIANQPVEVKAHIPKCPHLTRNGLYSPFSKGSTPILIGGGISKSPAFQAPPLRKGEWEVWTVTFFLVPSA